MLKADTFAFRAQASSLLVDMHAGLAAFAAPVPRFGAKRYATGRGRQADFSEGNADASSQLAPSPNQ